MLAIVLGATVSAEWAGTLGLSPTRFALIDRLGWAPFALYAVAPVAFSTARQRDILMGVLVVFGLYLGVTAVLEAVDANALVFPHYITDPNVGIHADRSRGPFLAGEAMGLGLITCGVAAAIALGRWRSRSPRALCWAVLGLCAAGVVLTYTRQIWVGAAAGVLVTLTVYRPLRWRVVPVVCLAPLLLASAVFLIPGLGNRLEKRANDSKAVWSRRTTTQEAVHMIAQRPVLGWGWGRFRTYANDHARTITDIPMSGENGEVHNIVLSYMVSLGILGGGLWLVAFLMAIGHALLRRPADDRELWRRGLTMLLVASLAAMVLSPMGHPFPSVVLFLWAGVLAGPLVSPEPSRSPARAARPPLAGRPAVSPAA